MAPVTRPPIRHHLPCSESSLAIFSEPRPNVIASDEGFSVEVLGRTGLRYVEGSRSARVDSELLVGEPAIVVYISRLKQWEPPYNGEAVDDATKRRILENIREAFRFKSHEIDAVV